MKKEVKLLMTFLTRTGRKVSLFVKYPKENLTKAQIKAVMDLILALTIFLPNGENIVSAKNVKIVQTSTTDYDLVIA